MIAVKHGSQNPPTYTPMVFPDSLPFIKASITKIITIQIKKQEVRSPIILVIVTLVTVRIVTAPARVDAEKQNGIKLPHILPQQWLQPTSQPKDPCPPTPGLILQWPHLDAQPQWHH